MNASQGLFIDLYVDNPLFWDFATILNNASIRVSLLLLNPLEASRISRAILFVAFQAVRLCSIGIALVVESFLRVVIWRTIRHARRLAGNLVQMCILVD